MIKIIIFSSLFVSLVSAIYTNDSKIVRRKHAPTPAEWADSEEDTDGLWSTLLEEWTIKQTENDRHGRLLQSHHRYIPTSNFYITKRMGEAMELEPLQRYPTPTAKVISPIQQQQQPSSIQNIAPSRQNFIKQSPNQQQVSETDLYLLGAIEKLVYRVDYMEHRLRRTEQLVYYLMEGNKIKQDSCPVNFTRAGENCYHVGNDHNLNWKTANTFCKSIRGELAELETIEEYHDVVAYLLNNHNYRGKDYWLGALNPGLLWIWSNSARPVNPNTNLTTFNKPATSENVNTTKITNVSNATTTQPPVTSPTFPSNGMEIKGTGRCLRLSYNPSLYTYNYTGQECQSRFHYLCEYKEKSLSNEISRLAKELNLN